MPATYRTVTNGGGSSGTGDRSVAVTPAIGDLLVVFVTLSANTNASPTCSDQLGGTYTRVWQGLWSASANNSAVFVADFIPTATTSRTITVASGSNTAGQISVIHVSGMTRVGSDAVRSSGGQANQALGGIPTPVLNQSALTTNPTLTSVFSGDTTTSPNASWTERAEVSQSSPTTCLEVATRDSGFTGTSIACAATCSTAFASFALELNGTKAPVAVNDTAAATDSVTKAATSVRSTSDTSVTTDTASRTPTFGRTVSDTAVATDASATVFTQGGQTYNRSADDTCVATDAASRTNDHEETIADAVTVTDALTAGAQRDVVVSDTVDATDAASWAFAAARAVSDAAAATDAAARTAVSVRTVSEGGGSSWTWANLPTAETVHCDPADLSAYADTDPIDSWTNSGTAAGNFNSAFAERPLCTTINGVKCALYNGTDHKFSSTGVTLAEAINATGFHVFAVVRIAAIDTDSTEDNNDTIITDAGMYWGLTLRRTAGVNYVQGWFWNAGTEMVESLGDELVYDTDTLIEFWYDGTDLWLRVGANAARSITPTTAPDLSNDGALIQGSNNNNNGKINGKIAELVVLDYALDASDQIGARLLYETTYGVDSGETASGGVAVTDTSAAAKTVGRAAADTAVATDASSSEFIRTYSRSADDTVVATDTSSRTNDHAETTSDTAVAADAAAATRQLDRSASDSAAAADAAAREIALGRAAADTTTATDTAARAVVLGRAAADTTTATDAAARAAALVRVASDAALATDTVARGIVLGRAAADTTTASDAAGREMALARAASDAAVATDASTRAPVFGRVASDAAVTSDTVAREAALVRAAADSGIAPDASSSEFTTPSGQTFTRASDDVAIATDAVVRAAAFAKAISDASIATDAAARERALDRAATDIAAATDITIASFWGTFNRTVGDTAVAADLPARAVVSARSATDVITVTDADARAFSIGRSSIDVAVVTGAASRVTDYNRTSSDAAAATDAAIISFAQTTNGTLAKTLANATLTATGEIMLGRLTATLGALTATATAVAPIRAALAATLAPISRTALAQVPVQGAEAAALAGVTIASLARVEVRAEVLATLAPLRLHTLNPRIGALRQTLAGVRAFRCRAVVTAPTLLQRPVVVAISRERMPFDAAGNLKSEPGPYPLDFMIARDLKAFGDPQNPNSRYVRRRGDEWTTEQVRAQLLAWVGRFVRTRAWAGGWQLVERWGGVMRQELGERRLVVRITRKQPGDWVRGGKRYTIETIETAIPFPRGAATDSAEIASALALIESSLDAEHARRG